MLYISAVVILGHVLAGMGLVSAHRRVDVVVLDGVSAPVPLFALAGIPVVFYCHYPDKLLCTERSGWLKRLYRVVIDAVEEATTGCATVIVVNSRFTARAFHASFPTLSGRFQPQVLYPTIDEAADDGDDDDDDGSLSATASSGIAYTAGVDHVFLSLNRYERKKNVGLALEAFAHVKRTVSGVRLLLVVAGGYDTRVAENVEHLHELKQRADALGLTHGDGDGAGEGAAAVDVVFRRSIPGAERAALLARATALLYTPDNEHFGIVPLEAMYARTPVVAVASGGPLETVVDGETGFLRPQDAVAFGDAMLALMRPPTDAQRAALAPRLPRATQLPRDVPLARLMGLAGRAHVQVRSFCAGPLVTHVVTSCCHLPCTAHHCTPQPGKLHVRKDARVPRRMPGGGAAREAKAHTHVFCRRIASGVGCHMSLLLYTIV